MLSSDVTEKGIQVAVRKDGSARIEVSADYLSALRIAVLLASKDLQAHLDAAASHPLTPEARKYMVGKAEAVRVLALLI